jgi:hypothetical protein
MIFGKPRLKRSATSGSQLSIQMRVTLISELERFLTVR